MGVCCAGWLVGWLVVVGYDFTHLIDCSSSKGEKIQLMNCPISNRMTVLSLSLFFLLFYPSYRFTLKRYYLMVFRRFPPLVSICKVVICSRVGNGVPACSSSFSICFSCS